MRPQLSCVVSTLAVAALLGAAPLMTGCKGPGPKQIGEATLAQASGVEAVPAEAEDAPVVELMPEREATIPEGSVVKLAIDRNTPWGQVIASLDVMAERQQTPVLLVAERRRVRALPAIETLAVDDEDEVKSFLAAALEVIAYTDGKVCVRHPEVLEAKCVQTPSKKYIDGAFTRQLVREATKGYGLRAAAIDLPAGLHWADAVRVIDGVRTCCGEDIAIRPVYVPPEALPERVQVPAE
ncbi:hypothetical protein [Haliangium ochraceum]|uniref:Lipoprotein n=1 Tax=Haliangium ochraceum (strain DSM 14365 / JCM 11303 / SMP-2) TaxID=502025 RepID=D0LHG1_HALO1|nr:hypothetical protein [Haliangium ochraceum]ACY12823.1 hypothetical protein Hoch_0182 [Haliangium ochraceum DSM 14365]